MSDSQEQKQQDQDPNTASNSQPEESTLKPTTISEEEKQKICALEYDIKNKGEHSYYYAHKARFEPENKDPNAKTIKGPGIITGGLPELLATEQRKVEEVKKIKGINTYQFYDDDKTAVVKIELPTEAEGATEEGLVTDFQKRSFNLTINTPMGETYVFKVGKLYQEIVPEKSTVKLIKTKAGKKVVKIVFYKVDIDEEWTKLKE